MRSVVLNTVIMLVMAGPFISVRAADFLPAATVLSDINIYDVQQDGTYTYDQTRAIRIDSDQGVKAYGQIAYHYSNSLQNLDVIEAYTTTRDGNRIMVKPGEILTQQSAVSANAPTFDDGKVKTIVFPAVQVGAIVTMHTRQIQKIPMFPGQFSTIDTFQNEKVFKSAKVMVNAPATMKLYADAIDMSGGQVSADDGGRQIWEWSIKDTSAHSPEASSPSIVDRSPRVAITTFPSYEAVGLAYRQRAAPQAKVTPEIKELADEVTLGISDEREQADALYRWVSNNVRYVAIFLGFGGVVPHSAQQVLETRYGDCKDHATILQALLAAKNISSSTVLVNADTRYWIPMAASPLAVFNHAITYIPKLDLFVDSTSGTTRSGTLPFSEQGKSALVTDDGNGHAKLVKLPLSTPQSNQVEFKSEIAIDENGSARGTSEVSNKGDFDSVARSIFSSFPSGMELQLAQRVLNATGQDGTGRYIHVDTHNLKEAFSYTTEFELPNYTQFPGPGAIRVPQGLNSFNNIASVFQLIGSASRTTPLIFSSRHISETTVIELPAKINVKKLPKASKVTSTFGTYLSSYTISGKKIIVSRTLDISMLEPYILPGQYTEIQALALAVKRDMAAQIVFD